MDYSSVIDAVLAIINVRSKSGSIDKYSII